MPVRTVAIGPRSGGGGAGLHGVGFDLDSPLEAGAIGQSEPQAIIGGTPRYAKANAKDVPTGADLIIDVEMSTDGGGSWASIFPAGDENKVVIPAESSAVVTITDFAISSVPIDAKFRPNILQVGSANAGGYVSLDVVWG